MKLKEQSNIPIHLVGACDKEALLQWAFRQGHELY